MPPSELAAQRRESWARRITPFVLAAYAGWEFRAFLADGLPLLFDAHSHLTRTWAVSLNFEAGQYPVWSNLWYGGYRLLGFYSPGFYALTAGAGLAIGDVVAATKLILWVGQIVAVLGLYAFVRRLSGQSLLAVLAALLLVWSPERRMVLGVIGNHPSVFLYAALPLLFYRITTCSAASWSPLRLFAAQSLLLAFLALGHMTNTLILLPAVLAFEVLWLWQERPAPGAWRPALLAVAGSLVALPALTLFVTLPLWTHLDRVSLSLTTWGYDTPSLEPLLILLGLAPQTLDLPFVNDHGTFWLVLGFAGGLLSLRRAGRRWRPLFAGLCANLASVALLGERAAIGTAFFLYPLCAGAIDIAGREASTHGFAWPRRLAPVLAIACAVLWRSDDGSPPPRYHAIESMGAYARLPATATRSRTFDVTPTAISLDGFYGPSSFSPYISARAVPFGGFVQGAPLATNLSMALASKLAEELSTPEQGLSEDALAILYLLHVGFLIDRDDEPVLERLRVDAASTSRPQPEVLQLRHAGPAIFSRRLAPLPEPHGSSAQGRPVPPRLLGLLGERWRAETPAHADAALVPLFRTREGRDWIPLLPLLRAMGIDRESATAERFFVEPTFETPERAEGPTRFAVTRHHEELTRVEIEARASAPGFVRLSYSGDPDLAVTLDDEPVRTWRDALTGAVIVAFPAGTHTISLRAPGAAYTVGLLGVSTLTAVGVATLLLTTRRRAPRANLDGP